MNFQYASAEPESHYEYIVSVNQGAEQSIKKQAIALMKQVEGWCSEEKASVLVDLILRTKPDIIVEIGVWGGKSLLPMSYALQANRQGVIYGIDPWSNAASVEAVENEINRAFWSYVDHEAIMRALIQKMVQFDLGDHIALIRSTSEDAPLIEDIDILHIDGNHSDKTSFIDVTKWVPLVKSGGWIIFDDMTWYENGKYTTAHAVEWLDTHCFKFAEFSDSCVWGIWVKP